MWWKRNSQPLLVVISQRTGEIRFDRGVAQREWSLLCRTRRTRWKDGCGRFRHLKGGNRTAPLTSKGRLFKLRAGKVERLRDEAAHLARTYTSRCSLRGGQIELLARARQRHVGEAPLFPQSLLIKRGWRLWCAWVARHDLIAPAELCRKGEARRASARREACLHHVRHKDHRKLQALRLMDGQQGNGVKIWVNIRGGWIVTRLTELFQVADEKGCAIEFKQTTA